ncbi:uncharacterized protein LOC128758234 isoform X1 [Synchiropus splendidus]|uniref:uncharacterized protein LOC128758234 isoform X1 n=1 Tax=Synchiropus splendidus TaxID=270530 RepID=UPI00237D4BCB|nr:uncharacterized protein LOC128758234 isoform X1 [Synchiropus splendidus]
MGNLPLCAGFFTSDGAPAQQSRYRSRRIRKGITCYYAPPGPPCSPSPDPPRPLLLFLAWLGAQPSAVSKYTERYLQRGMDVLLVQSSALHFLWPLWGLEYGSQVLQVLEEPQFSGRPLLVYASSIGGYTFTQVLSQAARRPQSQLPHTVVGHIYDSLVAGTLEHMATGLGKTLVPRLERLVKNTALLYFRLFRSRTADLYQRSIQVFNNNPITAPALFLLSEDDALCDAAVVERIADRWRARGVSVRTHKWKESVHAAHMRSHPEEYRCTLDAFLDSLPLPPPPAAAAAAASRA